MSRKKIIGIIIGAVLVIALFGVGIFLIEKHSERAVDPDDYEDYEDYEEEDLGPKYLYFGDDEYEITHNIETYLLMGLDESGNEAAVGTDDYRGRMADFLLLLVIDKTDNTYGFVQLNRDTMVDIPYIDTKGNGDGSAFEQLCIAHWYGGTPEMGCDNTVFVTSELLGDVPIDGYYSIQMSDIKILNHAVGGVEVTLEDDFSSVDPEMTAGKTLTLTDEQAEIFIRGRMEIGDGKNESRMRRQLQYMQGFKAKALQKIGEDASFIDDLLEALKADAVTDIPNSKISVIANQVYKNKDLGILQYEGEATEGDTLHDGIIHAEFYPDTDSIAKVMATLCGIDEAHIKHYEEYDDAYYETLDYDEED